MKRILAGLGVLACGAILATAVVAADENDKDTNKKQLSDKEFVQKVSAGGLAEVNMGNLARTKAADPAVRQFAERLVRDHTKANQELIQLANRKGWTLARTMNQHQQQEYDKLLKLSGQAFDREFVQHQVKDHKMDIRMFQNEAENGKDKDLQNWAKQCVPTLKEHLQIAQKLADNQKTNKERTSR